MNISTADFTAQGNAVAFTAAGETITVEARKIPYTPRRWFVAVCGAFGPSLTDSRNISFATKKEAAAYASSLADTAKTEELAWW